MDQSNIIPSKRYWRVQQFEQLSSAELYRLLSARVGVFVVEQNCPYPELDGLDQNALHISCLDSESPSASLLAYARILPPDSAIAEAAIGRVLTSQDARGLGLGRELMERALQAIEQTFGRVPVRISAQQHLEGFYQSLGFETVSAPYLEDGIPHLRMVFSWSD